MKDYWGKSVSVDVKNCSAVKIKDAAVIQDYVIQLCKMIGMTRFGDAQITYFGEDENVAGYSLVQLIETSLISGHFANKTNTAYIDIFSCKDFDATLVANFTMEYFEGDGVTTHMALRK